MLAPTRYSQMNVSGIYAIRHSSGREYIGSASSIYNRWRQHISGLRNDKHHSNYLQKAWNKYGASAFDLIILELCKRDLLIEREQHYIDTRKPVFNMAKIARNTPGGSIPQNVKEINRKRMLGNQYGKDRPYCGVLQEADIRMIFADFISGFNNHQLAEKYRIHVLHIIRILHRKVWASIELDQEILDKVAYQHRLNRRNNNRKCRFGNEVIKDIQHALWIRGISRSELAAFYQCTHSYIAMIDRGAVKPI